MCSRRRSQNFLQYAVNRGAEFLETLKVVYPHVGSLCEKDFDWLFDCPQTEQFLEWFCNTVSEENVLSPAEVEAYEALLAAGKPILEGDALDQVLQTCCQVPQFPSAIPDDEGPSLEALKQEARELQAYYSRQLWRHNKLQVWAASLQQELKYLAEEEEKEKWVLRKAQMDVEVENFQTTAVLSQISKLTTQLAEWHREVGKGHPPVLLCETDLGPYMELEQLATEAFERFIQQALPESAWAPGAWGVSTWGEGNAKDKLEAETQRDSVWEILKGERGTLGRECAETALGWMPASQEMLARGSRSELLAEGRSRTEEILSVRDQEGRGGSQEATERTETKQAMHLKSPRTEEDELSGNKDSYREELSQMEKAYICAQRELITMSAEVDGNCAALKWAQRALKAIKENQEEAEDKLQRHATTVQEQLHTLRCDIVQTQAHQLPSLLQAGAYLSCLPILQGQLSLEAARLQYIARRQEEAATWLVGQHSRLDLLALQLKQERKELDEMVAWLEEIETALREAQTKLQEQHDYFRDASVSQKGCQRTQIEPRDLSTIRLWDMLVGQDREEHLFRSYESIAVQASRLVQDQRMLEAQLAAPMLQLPALESATEVLYQLMYGDSNQLQLHSPEIIEPMQQLITMQNTLYQMLMDLLSDLKVKRRSLQSPILQTERNLYVYFFCNDDRLREVVEELEKQVLASSKGQLMELPYAE
ncbi:HAUS augmin-like complex subunit 3 [Struthio camelus]|uniref:HAUS augmin-like complex subunit 3 n=1 Tax=Struthio camelus TaxID=8801 RepID=UPI003603E551